MLEGRESKRPFSTSVPAPNARSTLIDPLVAVELFGIEEMKPELLAAGAGKVDLAFGAGTDVENRRLEPRPSSTAIERYDRADL